MGQLLVVVTCTLNYDSNRHTYIITIQIWKPIGEKAILDGQHASSSSNTYELM